MPHYINDIIAFAPNRYFGLIAYCNNELFRVFDYDADPDIRELVGIRCIVTETGNLQETSDTRCIDTDTLILFITPDIEEEFLKKYARGDEDMNAWLHGDVLLHTTEE